MDDRKLDRVVAEARRAREERECGYRERALKILPAIWNTAVTRATDVGLGNEMEIWIPISVKEVTP